MATLILQTKNFMVKLNSFQGDLTDISAKKASLFGTAGMSWTCQRHNQPHGARTQAADSSTPNALHWVFPLSRPASSVIRSLLVRLALIITPDSDTATSKSLVQWMGAVQLR